MVEVTKSNFDELFPSIAEGIKECSFIAIDSEFTGLNLDSTNEASLFDSLQERYQKLRTRASSFLPCQIGLSLFTRSKTENKYSVDTYIFYIRPYMCGSTDRKFMCQASSLDFLCRYDFDFNKFIKEGVPYINEDELVQLQKEIEDKTVGYNHEKMLQFKYKREIDWLINKNVLTPLQEDIKDSLKYTADTKKENTKVFTFDREKVIHEYFQVNELRQKYSSLWIWCSEGKINIESGFSKDSKEHVEKLKELQLKEQESLIDFYFGFTKVFRCLRLSSKPIVGHNPLLDLLLFYHNFYKFLPNTYKEFKKEMHSIFPVVFDTRHIWLNVRKYYKLKDIPTRCGLFELFDAFKNPTCGISTIFMPIIEHTNSKKYSTDEFPHESGYDSYVTGWVFLNICHVLALNKITNPVLIQPQTLKQHLMAVNPFVNKINLSHSKIRNIDLVNDEPEPAESQLLHIRVKNKGRILKHAEGEVQVNVIWAVPNVR